MTRHLRNLGLALSLLVCAASAALWVRGLAVSDRWDYGNLRYHDGMRDGTLWTITTGRGGVGVGRSRVTRKALPEGPRHPAPFWRTGKPVYPRWQPVGGVLVNHQAAGFQYYRSHATGSGRTSGLVLLDEQGIVLPLGCLILIGAILPTLRAVRVARHWRRCRPAAAGRCRVCGYDLRASPLQCPECGTPAGTGAITPG